jgi:hypothetical protein
VCERRCDGRPWRRWCTLRSRTTPPFSTLSRHASPSPAPAHPPPPPPPALLAVAAQMLRMPLLPLLLRAHPPAHTRARSCAPQRSAAAREPRGGRRRCSTTTWRRFVRRSRSCCGGRRRDVSSPRDTRNSPTRCACGSSRRARTCAPRRCTRSPRTARPATRQPRPLSRTSSLTRGARSPPPSPLPPVLTGHVSSLLPY